MSSPTVNNQMSSTTQNKELARRVMEECWNQGKMDVVRELFADDCRYHDPVFPSLTSGAENISRHIASCRGGFPDLNFTTDDMIAERNEVVIHWTGRGTHKGSFLGMTPTNRTCTVSGTSIFRIENGKVAETWSDWNLLSMLDQLGISATNKADTIAAA
jgi:steroid delta-isomerase-like uncharacterized protein